MPVGGAGLRACLSRPSRSAGLGRRWLAHDAGRHRDDSGEIREMGGHDEGRALFCHFPELTHVLLTNTQLHGFDPATFREGAADSAQALGSGGRDRENRRRLAVGLIYLLLLTSLGRFYDAL